MPRNGWLPRTCRGGRPSRVSMRAPIKASGSVTRRIGRFDSEASPTRVLSNACPASNPASSRMPVPALPQSSGRAVPRKPCRPTPRTTRSPAEGVSMRTPNCDNTAAVARVSSPSRKPLIRESPSAMAASISARCETDLSPGTRTLPCSGWPGWLLQSSDGLKAAPPGRSPARAPTRPTAGSPPPPPAPRRHGRGRTRR